MRPAPALLAGVVLIVARQAAHAAFSLQDSMAAHEILWLDSEDLHVFPDRHYLAWTAGAARPPEGVFDFFERTLKACGK